MAEDADGGDPQADDGPGEFARVLSSACALGSAILRSVAGPTETTGPAAVFAPLIEPLRRAGSAAADMTTAQSGVDIAGFLGQTWMTATTSGVRYWARLAQMHGEHQPRLLQALLMGERSEYEHRAMIDELRAYVRDLGDLASQEARMLQSELDRLSGGLTAAVGSGAAPAQYRRRWRAKP